MEKEMKIIPPVGYEIDTENSTFSCIKFKPAKQELTYEDVCKKIFREGKCYYTNPDGSIDHVSSKSAYCIDENDAPTKEQLEKILAINQLQNIANYYNGDWKPNWSVRGEYKYVISHNGYGDYYNVCIYENENYGMPVFKNKADAQAVIDNPNFREILDKIYKS